MPAGTNVVKGGSNKRPRGPRPERPQKRGTEKEFVSKVTPRDLLEALEPLAQRVADDAIIDEDDVREEAEELLHRVQSAITLLYLDTEPQRTVRSRR